MTIKIIEAFECTCDKCNYIWSSIKLPATCANKTCRSPRWNKPSVGTLANPQNDLAYLPTEIKKNSAASPEVVEIPERYNMYFKVQEKLNPEKVDADKQALLESLKPLLDPPVRDKSKSVLPEYPPRMDDYGPIIDYSDV